LITAIISAGIGVVLLIIYCFRRKFSSNRFIYFGKNKSLTYQTIEAFLENHEPLAIRRYSYLDIKKMTNLFRDKLGEGGYGGVYWGRLQDGCLVAVKVLKELRGNGEEFINEVASISRTSHVNIVSLLGFCFEGSKRALIYEFMPNGSLEKFIYKKSPSQDERQLEWETLYKIALGIARGLEYLHRGCNTRIVHFDIKPHNILLDENFCPKISDFGLAKICPREKSIISMLGARGTVGYIAPEVFCRNFGEVSHKSDVYSYGMMVFEMVGGKRNINVEIDRTSEIFFPDWIYKRLEQDEDLGLHGLMNEEDHEHARKMIIVSLWCIQTNPSSRPPMSRVVSMLEGSLESLQIPPMPFLYSPLRSPEASSTTMRSELEYDYVMP
jgi:serine/threonine protein kinase